MYADAKHEQRNRGSFLGHQCVQGYASDSAMLRLDTAAVRTEGVELSV